jgi:uncharacterized repeat protein (TIGR02059 family)
MFRKTSISLKYLFALFFLSLGFTLYGTTYYVSTNGNDNNPGTYSSPWLTWQKAFDVATAGDVVNIMGGVYYTSGTSHGNVHTGVLVSGKNGTSSNRITIQAYQNEVPILDCSSMSANATRRGIDISGCSYYVFIGLTVRNVKEYGQYANCPTATGIFINSSNNINIERCVVNGCGDGYSTTGFCNYIDFLNCDSYDNIDFSDGGGFANGWTLTMYLSPSVYASGTHVSLTGCRSWGNSDDGFDMYGANGYFTYTDCWAFDNGRNDGNGDGFKSHPMGSKESGVQRTFNRCTAFNNKGSGFTSEPYVIENIYNCVSYNSGQNGFGYNTGDNLACVFKNNISYKDGYVGLSNFINTNNTWNGNVTVTDADFLSLDDSGSDGPRQADGSLPDLSFLHLAPGSDLINAGVDVGLPYGGSAPDMGAFESDIEAYVPPSPIYISSAIENSTPSVLEITYSLALTDIVPATSAFSVQVNSTARTITSVTVSGTKVLLTLGSPVAYSNVITVSYIVPSSSPLQTADGAIAGAFSANSVTNDVNAPPIPVYSGATVENASPSVIVMTYNLSLANIVPAASAFSVKVNSAARTVSSVAVSGAKVLLTIASPVVFGNVVTIAYAKPSANPLQTSSGGQAATISAQTVTNKVNAVSATPPVVTPPVVVNSPPVVVINNISGTYSGFIGNINASGSYDSNKDNLTYTWKVPANIPVSATNTPVIEFLAPIVEVNQTYQFTLTVSDGKSPQTKTVPVTIIPYEPGLEKAEVIAVEAENFQSPNYPLNLVDGNLGTMWSVNGYDQWIILELKGTYSVQHVEMAFQPGQKKEFYFDIFGSNDKENWELILSKSRSCAFSGNLQVFGFPPSKTEKEFRYVKLVGQGNSVDKWNYIAEFRIFGYRHKNPVDYEDQIVKIYPNPAHELVNILIDESNFMPDFIKIVSLTGKVIFDGKVESGTRQLQIPIDFKQGIYIVQMGTGDMTMFTQKLIVSK